MTQPVDDCYDHNINAQVLLEQDKQKAEVSLPPRMTTEDRLRLENTSLQMENTQLQLQVMQADIQKALARRNELVVKMGKMRDEYQNRYGVDVTCISVSDDGTITQTGAAPARTRT
jgi:hypothetical protein